MLFSAGSCFIHFVNLFNSVLGAWRTEHLLYELGFMLRALRKRVFGHMRTVNAKISLRIRAVWSEPSLSASRILGYKRMCQWKGLGDTFRGMMWIWRFCACSKAFSPWRGTNNIYGLAVRSGGQWFLLDECFFFLFIALPAENLHLLHIHVHTFLLKHFRRRKNMKTDMLSNVFFYFVYFFSFQKLNVALD